MERGKCDLFLRHAFSRWISPFSVKFWLCTLLNIQIYNLKMSWRWLRASVNWTELICSTGEVVLTILKGSEAESHVFSWLWKRFEHDAITSPPPPTHPEKRSVAQAPLAESRMVA